MPEQRAAAAGTAPMGVAEMTALQRGAGNAAVVALLREVAAGPPAPPAGTPRAGSLIVADDAAEVLPGQIRLSEFVAELRTRVNAVIDEMVSGTLRVMAALAFVERWFSGQAGRPAADVERTILGYVPEAAAATTARDYVPAIVGRVRREVAQWMSAGEEGEAPDEGARILPKRDPGASRTAPTDDPAAVVDRLGRGRPLDGGVQQRLGSVLGRDLSDVRVHDDGQGAGVARDLGARAVAVGGHIAFAPGEYRPGTPVGDALLAHELAHVAQQADGAARGAQGKGGEGDAALETEADLVAAGAVVGLWAGLPGRAAELARLVTPRLRSGLRLQSCGRSAPVAVGAPPAPAAPAAPAVPTTRGPDMHAGAHAPDAATQRAILSELNPGAFDPAPPVVAPPVGAPPARIPWDGATGQPNFAARRRVLKTTMTAAMVAHLRAAMPAIRAEVTRPRLPIASFEGPGRGAKTTVDAVFGGWKAAAALSAAGRHGVSFSASGPGRNLFDANDPPDRAAAGAPISAESLTAWIAGHDPAASTIAQRHHFDPDAGGEQEAFFTAEILTPFAGAHRADLELYDLWGFALAPEGAGIGRTVATPTTLRAGLSTAPGVGGAPSPAERATRWDAWKILVHEYIHTLAHPSFDAATSAGGSVMQEGFCEMFTAEVLDARVATAGGDAALRAVVEGSATTPAPTARILPATYTSPGTYVADRGHAENIRTRIGPASVRAAYFQGHIEFLGLLPGGAPAAPVIAADICPIPRGVDTLAKLVAASGVPEAEIRAANPAETFAGALPATLALPGCREHRVVGTRDAAARAEVTETRAQIAEQNGVSEADLVRANPAIDWTLLTDGVRLLIPRH